ncbi:MAG: hypothetical protein HPY69_18320 [Armatimonadetes bacterium]|nr:hypothetical protein [Armatimonadota bacterium]
MRPNYDTARADAGFTFSVSGSQAALRELTGTPIREFNLDPQACIDCYRRGRPLLREMFGDKVSLPGVSTPAISYGHVNGLGSELRFPEGGEVAQTHVCASLEDGLAVLAEPVSWTETGWAPYFLGFLERLKDAFPEERVSWSWGGEGPITTAYELRGEGFFLDVHDRPAMARQFLSAINRSLLDFERAVAAVNERPVFGPSAGLCDDLASFIRPALFAEIVLPAWEEYYTARTDGMRTAHVEDLRAEQLPFLEDIGLGFFDPSISPRLTPQLVAAHCRVPFAWRLVNFHYAEMTVQDVEDFVFQSCADGASGVYSDIADGMCNEATVPKVEAFIRAAKEAQALLTAGCSRSEIAQRVSPAGRDKLWDAWCGYLGPRSSRGGARATAPADTQG